MRAPSTVRYCMTRCRDPEGRLNKSDWPVELLELGWLLSNCRMCSSTSNAPPVGSHPPKDKNSVRSTPSVSTHGCCGLMRFNAVLGNDTTGGSNGCRRENNISTSYSKPVPKFVTGFGCCTMNAKMRNTATSSCKQHTCPHKIGRAHV